MSLVYHGSILLYIALARENELAARFFKRTVCIRHHPQLTGRSNLRFLSKNTEGGLYC